MATIPANTDPGRTFRTVFHVAWIAISLGLCMELLVVVVSMSFGAMTGIKQMIADTVQKTSWSVIVCIGLAFGNAASRMQVPVMGLLGFFAAPVAFIVARSAHKSTQQMMSLAVAAGGGPSPYVIGALKAVEYAILGILLGMIAGKAWGGFKAHAAIGLGVGIVFGGAIVAYMGYASPTPTPMPVFLSRCFNEVLFPVGCGVALHAGYILSSRIAIAPPETDDGAP